jgi:hypothetical protein
MNSTNSHLLLARAGVLAAIVLFCTVAANAQNNFNLADFDAVGDGVADDGPALQRALDAVALAGGGTLFIPKGLYKIETPVLRDFAGVDVNVVGVPSDTMPAPPTANGDELARSLDLQSEFIPATGENDSAITLLNANNLTVEHLAFTGTQTSATDAYITLLFTDVNHAAVRHCEFYGISTFGSIWGSGGGNIIRAVRSELSIESTVFLGCTANSGTYAPIVENFHWKRFSISNSIFIDYGLRSFFGKMGLGAPLSWINFGSVAPRTPEAPRREIVVRDTFMDEGGWVGMTAYPHLWGEPVDAFDLVYISGLKMNVSNMGTSGHQFFDVRNVMIENSHYGWSKNAFAAIDIFRTDHAILDRLTCIAHADQIRARRTERLTIINSVFAGLADSDAVTTTVLEIAPEDDPVQYVRQQFLSKLGRQPDAAAHFHWSDLLIRCGTDNACLNRQRAAFSDYLESSPQAEFSISGNVVDENGDPLSGTTITLTGSQSAVAVSDELGNFRFSELPTAGTYTVTASKRHYTFAGASKTFLSPPGNVVVDFKGTLNRHTISGRITRVNGTNFAGVTVNLVNSETATTTTDANGLYSFANLPAGQNYTITAVPKDDFLFVPFNAVLNDLAASGTVNFSGRLRPELAIIPNTELALVLDSVSFLTQPFSIEHPLDFADDGLARAIIFATNIQYVWNTSMVAVTAEDENHAIHSLPVEFQGNVVGQPWLKQLNIKLSPEFDHGKCLQLRVSVDGVQSNPSRLCFAPELSSP